MKYIITESQYLILKESIIPISIKRRANEETLKQYITMGEINYPTLCDDFSDEYEYADNVIDYAVDEFVEEIDDDITEKDYYSDVMDYLRALCRKLFTEYLTDIYLTTCEEYLNETAQKKDDSAKWITCKNCNKKFTQTIHKGKKSLPICPTCGTHNNTKENVIKEDDDFQGQWDLIVDFEKILNRKMPQKFPWWKEIEVESFSYNGMGQISVYGKLTVDEDWARNQFNTLHPPSIRFPGVKNVEFIDLLTTDEWNEIRGYFSKYYFLLSGQNADRITMNRLNILFDSHQQPKMEQNEGELTERCWKGYTQKGMKTMFGKRYPNCVKKKK